MRTIFLLLFIIPLTVTAQVNRSANELANERIKEYVETKLFRELSYTPITPGELKSFGNPMSPITWTIVHQFQIASPVFGDQKTSVTKTYSFSFYLDKRLKVLRAESYHLD